MSLFPFFLIFLLALSLCQSHHVVFEDVGQVAVSTTYLHAVIPLNITGVHYLIKEYQKTIDIITNPKVNYINGLEHEGYQTGYYFGLHFKFFMNEAVEDIKKYANQMRRKIPQFRQRLHNILEVLPKAHATATPQTGQPDLVRVKRFLPLAMGAFAVAKGIFGTFMGLYNRQQLKQLQTELQTTIREQRRILTLLQVGTPEDGPISDLRRGTHEWVDYFRLFSPLGGVAVLLQQEILIEREVHRVLSAVQQAHHRRLSVDLLLPHQLNGLYDALQRRAIELEANLLLERPSDLFQTEASYAIEGEDVALVLHVPIATKNTLLRLFRFHPFPLSFSRTHFLVPHSRHQLFAISQDASRLGLDLTEADLEGCYRLNGLHLCERLGVLHTRLARTCLGALYDQKFKAALALCEMDLEPIQERVLQLSNNWFLVFANASFTAGVRCRNNTANEIHLKTGLNKIHISPSCQAQLQQHRVFSDTALRATSDIKEFEWDLEDHAFSEEEVREADEVLSLIEPEGANKPTLAAVRRQTAQNKRSPKWLWFFLVLGFLSFLGLSFALFSAFYARKWWILRRAVQLLIHRVWNSIHEPPATTKSAHVLGAASEPRLDRGREVDRNCYSMRASRRESPDSPASSPDASRKKKMKKKGRAKLQTRFERALTHEPPKV